MLLGIEISCFSSSQLKGLQNCDLSKLEVEEKSRTSREIYLVIQGSGTPTQEFLFDLQF